MLVALVLIFTSCGIRVRFRKLDENLYTIIPRVLETLYPRSRFLWMAISLRIFEYSYQVLVVIALSLSVYPTIETSSLILGQWRDRSRNNVTKLKQAEDQCGHVLGDVCVLYGCSVPIMLQPQIRGVWVYSRVLLLEYPLTKGPLFTLNRGLIKTPLNNLGLLNQLT